MRGQGENRDEKETGGGTYPAPKQAKRTLTSRMHRQANGREGRRKMVTSKMSTERKRSMAPTRYQKNRLGVPMLLREEQATGPV